MQLRRFAVIGHPIGHTMSPFIHDRLFSLTGHKPEYSVLDVPSLVPVSYTHLTLPTIYSV